MSLRRNKRRAMKVFHGRFHPSFIWQSAEDREWLDAVPIGHEFGSKDYARLTILDMYSWGNITEQEAIRQLDIDRAALVAMMNLEGYPLTPELIAAAELGPISNASSLFGRPPLGKT